MHLVKKKTGFTLLELLVVVLAIGILSSIALPQYRRAVERSRVAEAQTLLRSIFDARERLALEKNFGNTPVAADFNYGFDKLDISIKGTYGDSNMTLHTKNFDYIMVSGMPTVTAQATKGDYTGSTITFNGGSFICSSSNGACTAWGSSGWNK